MALQQLPCAIACAAASSSTPALLSLHSTSAKFDEWSSKSVVRTNTLSYQSPSQGLGRQGWRDVGRRVRVRSSTSGNGDGERELSYGGEIKGEEEGETSNSGRVEVEVSPTVMKQLEAASKKKKDGLTMMEILEEVVGRKAGEAGEKSSGLSLIEQNMKKRRERFEGQLDNGDNNPKPAAVPLSFDVDARNDENRFDGAYFARLEELGEETLEINTLDDFYPAFIILITDALLELGDLMKMLGDGEFFSTQAMLRASRIPVPKSSLKGFPDDIQLRRSIL